MTTKLIALWTAPDDGAGFDADYLATHAKLASAIPGVTFTSGKCVSGPYYRMAQLREVNADLVCTAGFGAEST